MAPQPDGKRSKSPEGLEDELTGETSGLANPEAGLPLPGSGAHPKEDFLWDTPVFKKHPLTKEKEAVGGIFFRLTPENVRVLQEMKNDGWPHVEIVRVAKELWKHQLESHQKNEDIAQQHKDISHNTRVQEANQVYEPIPGEEGGSQDQGQGGEMEQQNFWRALSMTSGPDYREKIEQYRGRSYAKDGGSTAGVPMTRSNRSDASEGRMSGITWFPPLRKGTEFAVEICGDLRWDELGLEKADTTGGVRELPLYELKRKKDQSFTRKEAGVNNAASTVSGEDRK